MIIGIVGKPNVGKSAFFRSLTLADAPSGNFPFTTIDANSAIGYVKIRDPAQDFGKVSNPREGFVLGEFRFVPIEIIDVAGLVPGAHEGLGLGNKFLDDLRQADALIHVIDLSGGTNEKGEPIEINTYNPAEDIRFLEKELDHWYFNILERNFPNIDKKIRMQDVKPEIAFGSVLSGLKISEKQILRAFQELGLGKGDIGKDLFSLAKKLREISKPMIIAANKCDVLLDNNLWQKKLEDLRKEFEGYRIVPVMAEYEWNLRRAAKAGLLSYIPGEKEFEILKEESLSLAQKEGLEKIRLGISRINSTGVQECLNLAVFDILKMKAIFPGGVSKLEDSKGNVLPDCFLMPEKSTALDFAYRLHSDFGKNFIRAINVRTKLPVGKDTILEANSIVEIISGK